MKHGVYVDGLLETSVASAREAYEVLSTGWANRRVAATSMNRESSRSHAVFTLTIESKKRVRVILFNFLFIRTLKSIVLISTMFNTLNIRSYNSVQIREQPLYVYV